MAKRWQQPPPDASRACGRELEFRGARNFEKGEELFSDERKKEGPHSSRACASLPPPPRPAAPAAPASRPPRPRHLSRLSQLTRPYRPTPSLLIPSRFAPQSTDPTAPQPPPLPAPTDRLRTDPRAAPHATHCRPKLPGRASHRPPSPPASSRRSRFAPPRPATPFPALALRKKLLTYIP